MTSRPRAYARAAITISFAPVFSHAVGRTPAAFSTCSKPPNQTLIRRFAQHFQAFCEDLPHLANMMTEMAIEDELRQNSLIQCWRMSVRERAGKCKGFH